MGVSWGLKGFEGTGLMWFRSREVAEAGLILCRAQGGLRVFWSAEQAALFKLIVAHPLSEAPFSLLLDT